ncbi:MAG: hypothetical protein ACXAC8_03675 [Candidatus Hodarchaeales archaeon]
MSITSKRIILCAILLFGFCFNVTTGTGAEDLIEKDPLVILFDEGHGQFFNRSLYSQAISDLRAKNMEVMFNTGSLNKTSLEGIDIFISTNPSESYSNDEQHYISSFLDEGNTMFLLANPLNEDNTSLNGNGYILNEILDERGISTGGRNVFWTYPEDTGSVKRTNVIHNDFDNAGVSEYLHLKINISDNEILSMDSNLTSIVTYSCSVQDPNEGIILASPEAYTKSIKGSLQITSDITMIGTTGELDIGARIVLCGSSIMFSDLPGPFTGYSWYESENNSVLWQNIIDWLAAENPEILPPTIASESGQVLISMIAVSIIFLVSGSTLFIVGSGKKVSIMKSEEKPEGIAKPQISTDKRAEPSTPSQQKKTRRDRRLKQINKGQQKKRKNR